MVRYLAQKFEVFIQKTTWAPIWFFLLLL